MKDAQTPLKDIDVGRNGFTGHYDRLMTNLWFYTPKFLVYVGIWFWLNTVPPKYDFRLSNLLTVMLIVRIILLIGAARLAWALLVGLWHGLKWLQLERIGPQWALKNDQYFRVKFYRSSDGTIETDSETRAQRLRTELDTVEGRKRGLWSTSWSLALNVTGCLLVPVAFSLVYGIIDMQWPGSTYVQRMSTNLHLPGFIQFIWLITAINKLGVGEILHLMQRQIYRAGAHYIPGAHVRDPFIVPKTLETVRAHEGHGNAKFVEIDEAVQSLGANE